MESEEATQLPSIDAGGRVVGSRARPGDGRAHQLGCFVVPYLPLTPELRAALFDGAVRPLFALPVDAKRRNYYGDDKPYQGYIRGHPGRVSSESLAIVDGGSKPENVRAFADLVWPDDSRVSFSETVHGAAKWMSELEEMVRRMVLEVQTRDGDWIRVKPSPTSLVVMVGNALRAWTNDRLHAPFHRVTISGDVTRFSSRR